MKLWRIAGLCCLCCMLLGCSNSYAEQEYGSYEKMVYEGDRYSKKDSVLNPIDGGYSFTVSKFDGRETLCIWEIQEDTNFEMKLNLSLAKGQCKLIIVDEDGNITPLVECTPDTAVKELELKELSLKKGKNRLEFIGYNCQKIDLKFWYEEP